ncbi:unnamed protein product [Cladocopium goreaui]|uniref:Protein RRC1-like (Reduced red-light responses in CRY1CRY2 background 1-like protein) n=1 Tax=Cladocopium goreaui TaxID=2562237 RepID=A0A9P1FY88_9DINO|nr:unnamed protein product [Cladocopium goreaui]
MAKSNAPLLPGPVQHAFEVEGAKSEAASQPIFQEGDVFAGFCRAVCSFLLGRGLTSLNKVASAPLVQAEWAALQQLRAVGKSTKMKQVLLDRHQLFEVQLDAKSQPHVWLITNPPLAALSHFSAMAAASAAIAAAAGAGFTAPEGDLGVAGVAPMAPMEASQPGEALRPELLAALRAHLLRQNGRERHSVLRAKFGVKQAQLRPYFQVLPAGQDAVVALDEKSTALPLPKVPGPINSSVNEAMQGLAALMGELNCSRVSIGRAMVFCMDRAEHHAALLSRRLSTALAEPSLTVTPLARFYLISDVLHNAGCDKPGARHFRDCLQDLLPEALGRCYLRRLELPQRKNAEARLLEVLHCWVSWNIFPSLYTKGLEALLLSPVLSLDAESETDLLLKQKLQRWFSGDQSQLPYAARLRGLAGKAQKSEVCRARLCHFERFWHRPGMEALEPDEVQRPAVNAAANAWAPRLLSDARSVAPLAPGAAVRVKLRGSDDLGICEFYEPQSGLWHVRFCDGLQRLAPQQLIRLGGNEEGDAIDGEELSQQELQQLTEEPPMKRARTRCQLVFDFKRHSRFGSCSRMEHWSMDRIQRFPNSKIVQIWMLRCQ